MGPREESRSTYAGRTKPNLTLERERFEGSEAPDAYSMLYAQGFERLRTKLWGIFSSRLVVHFDVEAQIFNHAPYLLGRLAWCREVAVHENGVGWIESERVKAA